MEDFLENKKNIWTCNVCESPLSIITTFPCSCKKVSICFSCLNTFRRTKKNKNCPICFKFCEYVITDTCSVNKSVFDTISTNSKYDIFESYYINVAVFSDIKHQLFYKCYKDCNKIFLNVQKLVAHVVRDHNTYICALCYEVDKDHYGPKTEYTKEEYDLHISNGNYTSHNIYVYHPLCKFCNKRFYNYFDFLEHMETHYKCKVCVEFPYMYYENFNSLLFHAKNEHYICTHPDCAQKNEIISFQSDKELKTHNKSHKAPFYSMNEESSFYSFNDPIDNDLKLPIDFASELKIYYNKIYPSFLSIDPYNINRNFTTEYYRSVFVPMAMKKLKQNSLDVFTTLEFELVVPPEPYISLSRFFEIIKQLQTKIKDKYPIRNTQRFFDHLELIDFYGISKKIDVPSKIYQWLEDEFGSMIAINLTWQICIYTKNIDIYNRLAFLVSKKFENLKSKIYKNTIVFEYDNYIELFSFIKNTIAKVIKQIALPKNLNNPKYKLTEEYSKVKRPQVLMLKKIIKATNFVDIVGFNPLSAYFNKEDLSKIKSIYFDKKENIPYIFKRMSFSNILLVYFYVYFLIKRMESESVDYLDNLTFKNAIELFGYEENIYDNLCSLFSFPPKKIFEDELNNAINDFNKSKLLVKNINDDEDLKKELSAMSSISDDSIKDKIDPEFPDIELLDVSEITYSNNADIDQDFCEGLQNLLETKKPGKNKLKRPEDKGPRKKKNTVEEIKLDPKDFPDLSKENEVTDVQLIKGPVKEKKLSDWNGTPVTSTASDIFIKKKKVNKNKRR